MRRLLCLAALASAALTSCGGEVERELRVVRVAPQADPQCGAPADGRSLLVRALGPFAASEETAQAIELGEDALFDIRRFPPETRVLELEVRGFGGELRSVGRSAPFRLEDLGDGDEIPVFMAPLDGLCPTGPSATRRGRPLLARAGAKVLVVGGVDEAGQGLSSAELYDPRTGRFAPLEGELYGSASPLGMVGATATTLRDGRVALVGGGATAYQLFEPSSEAFEAPGFYREARGHHSAIELEDGRLLLVGGCSQLLADRCDGASALLTTSIFDVESGDIELGPRLASERLAPQLFAMDGEHVLLLGGRDGSGEPAEGGEILDLETGSSTRFEAGPGVAARAPAGAVFHGFVGPGGAASSQLAVVSPESSEAVELADASQELEAHQALALEDGSLLYVGEQALALVRSFDGEARQVAAPDGDSFGERSAIRLEDGSVLLVGGAEQALVFRPSLVSAFSAVALASFGQELRADSLSSSGPDELALSQEEGSHLSVSFGRRRSQELLLAGPQFERAQLEISVSSEGASVGVLFGWESYAKHWRLDLKEGAAPELARIVNGERSLRSECVGGALAEGSLAPRAQVPVSHELVFELDGASVGLELDGQAIASCTLDETPAPGLLGVRGSGDAGDRLRVDLVNATRL